jgi:hypothetical protein
MLINLPYGKREVARLLLTFDLGLDLSSNGVDVNGLVNVIAGVDLGRNEQNRHSPTLSVHGCFMLDIESAQVVRTTTGPTACGSDSSD